VSSVLLSPGRPSSVAMPIARGPCLQPPSSASETIQRRHHPSPVWSQNMRRVTPCPSWPRRWLGRSLPCANDQELAIRRSAANAKRSGRGAEEPQASLDPEGISLQEALDTAACLASRNAQAPIGPQALSPALGVDLRARSCLYRRLAPTAGGCCPSPAPASHGTTSTRCAPSVRRTGGGHRSMARSQSPHGPRAALVAPAVREPHDVCGVAPYGLRRHTAITSAHTTVG
jgi:hypothetical protein